MSDLRKHELMGLSYAEDFTVFSEMLRYMAHVTPVQRFLVACERDGGIQEVERHDGMLDLNTPISLRRVRDRDFIPITMLTLGVEALRRAIIDGIPANVAILLDRGVECADEILAGVHYWWPEKEPEKFHELQVVLSRRTPKLVLVQSSNPAQVIWTSEQAVGLKPDEVTWAKPIEHRRDEPMPWLYEPDDGN